MTTLRDETRTLMLERMRAALDAADGNRAQAARALGLTRGAFVAAARRWGLPLPPGRPGRPPMSPRTPAAETR